MRILFATGTSTGGAARSTEQLADRLHDRGHHIAVLSGWRPRPEPRQLDARSPAWRRMAARWSRLAAVFRRGGGGRVTPVGGRPYPAWRSRSLERALPLVLDEHRPDVVVVSALATTPWVTVRRNLAQSGTPCVLYVRAEGQLHQLAVRPLPDLVIANAEAHQAGARARGVEAVVVPSVVDTEVTRVESTRTVALFVNPGRRHGLSRVVALARARPDVPFVIQESKPLGRLDWLRLRVRLGTLSNVELRRAVDPGALYADARILLAPYPVSNRPRVVLEAHANGIPVLGADVAGLRECVLPGGILVALDAPFGTWADALATLWDDPASYAAMAAAALRHSERDEVRPDVIVGRFEDALASLLGRPRP